MGGWAPPWWPKRQPVLRLACRHPAQPQAARLTSCQQCPQVNKEPEILWVSTRPGHLYPHSLRSQKHKSDS